MTSDLCADAAMLYFTSALCEGTLSGAHQEPDEASAAYSEHVI